MAVSSYGAHNKGLIQVPCILEEGNITVASDVFGPDGYTDTGVTFATKLQKNDPVAIMSDSANTYDACRGMPVVTKPTNGTDLVIGQIITTPVWEVVPTASQTTWADMLTYHYYRVATVELWGGITALKKAKLTCQDAVAISPGDNASLDLDLTVSYTDHDICVQDVAASAGSGLLSFHYAAKASSGVYSLLVGINGIVSVAT